ncbi:hypothetical protein AB0J20_05010 [Micromonospora costi]|uniref:hypothetical protein n=1 Tax=Micromonospora costi TaxID=1530042 RepID=UPI0033DFC6AB
MDNLVIALGELDAGELDILVNEFFMRATAYLEVGRDGWAAVYAAIAVAGVTALEGRQ